MIAHCRQIFQANPDGVLCVDQDRRIIFVNPAAELLFGYGEEELLGRRTDCLYSSREDYLQVSRERFRCNAELESRPYEKTLIRKDGTTFAAEIVANAVKGEEGGKIFFLKLIRDITRRKSSELALHQALSEIKRYKEQLEAESEYLREEMKLSLDNDVIIGGSNSMEYIFFKIDQISDSNTTVLLLGETGTGKELLARSIHNSSPRKSHPLIKIDCTALPEYLIESELFGHEKGAFTGAAGKRIGRFELADKGTIFLDEIGEMPPALQPKLLRILQSGEFERVGSSHTRRVDVRVIAATNRDLYQDMKSGRFRKDLWYRLNVFPITVPPLRDRIEDIPRLVRYFLDRHSCRQRKNITTIPAEVMMRLGNYQWPGNVRELENVIERAVINTSDSTLALADELRPAAESTSRHQQTLEEMECRYITEVLHQTGWKVSGKNSAAEVLGLKRSTLRARIKKCNIHRP